MKIFNEIKKITQTSRIKTRALEYLENLVKLEKKKLRKRYIII